MSSRRTVVLPLLVAVSLVLGIRRTAVAQNPGDLVTVQFGNYLSPTASKVGPQPFLSFYPCYPLRPLDETQICDIENRTYAASVFVSAIASAGAIDITSFQFFSAYHANGSIQSNLYDVYMGAGTGPLSFFGTFGNPRQVEGLFGGNRACDDAPSPTCVPDGVGGRGSYLYDPSLGDLHVRLVEVFDAFNGDDSPYWYDQYPSGGSGIVTRFDGTVVSTPEPSTIVLVGSGFASLLGFVRRGPREASHGRRRGWGKPLTSSNDASMTLGE